MGTAAAYPVRAPQWVLTYEGMNITSNVSQMVVGVTYVDHLDALSGEVEIEVEDRDQRWQGPWYPGLGDQINLMIGYLGEPMLPCGDFEIARTIAAKYGYSVVSAPDAADVRFERVTQNGETDLAFLKRLAGEHDFDFTVRGTTLVFYARAALEGAAPIAVLQRSDTLRFGFNNRTRHIYRSATVSYQDPATKNLITQSASSLAAMPTGDTLKRVARCENGQQAAIKAAAALDANNRKLVEGDLRMPGSTALSAGNNVALSGFGNLDGIYLIRTARHRIAREAGYVTDVEVRRVQ
jgi:phage protein D